MPIFSAGELARRQESFSKRIAERNIEWAVFSSSDAVYYITGVPLLSPWGRPTLAVMGSDGQGCIIGSNIEAKTMEKNTNLADVRTYGDDRNVHESALQMVVDYIKSRQASPGCIGIESCPITLNYYTRLTTAFPAVKLLDISDIVYDLRIIKSGEELEILRLGGEIAKIGASAFLEALQENVTELSVAAYAVQEMDKALGALYPLDKSEVGGATSSYAYCHSGEHTFTPHAHPTGKRIIRNEVIGLNVFPVIWGYCTELERTFVFGEPSREQQKALDAINEAMVRCKAALVPGVGAWEVDKLALDILLNEHKFSRHCILHGTGHSMGIMIGSSGREELGELRPYNKNTLKAGMVISVEPALYIPGVAGFRHSDVMEVCEKGSKCQTEFPQVIQYR